MFSFLVDDNNEYIKAKGINKNAVLTILHNKYNDALLNNKFLRYSTNRIKSKDHKIVTYETKKKIVSLALMTNYISKTMDTMD